jgi:hypothetical protein
LSKKNTKANGDEAFRVGAKVRLPWDRGTVEGQIVDDLDCLGVGGRHLWGVRFLLDLPEPFYAALGKDELTLAEERVRTPKT